MEKLSMRKRPANIEGGRYLIYYDFSKLEPEWEEKLAQLREKLISRCASADTEILERAYKTAYDAHSGQTRDQGTPYFEHPVAVANILLDELNISDPELVCSALLHDVLEDSDMTCGQLKAQFGSRIADIVRSVTKNEGENREQYLDRIQQGGKPAILLKLADRLDNLRSLPLSPKESKRGEYLQNTRLHYLPLAKRFNPYLYLDFGRLKHKPIVAQLSKLASRKHLSFKPR